MDNQQPLSVTLRVKSLPTLEKHPTPTTTSAQLLQDKQALNDWVNNIEKMRGKDIPAATAADH